MDVPAYKDFLNATFGRNRLFNQKAVLIADSYKVHISAEIKEHYKNAGIRPIIIPGGCTGILQVNKHYMTS